MAKAAEARTFCDTTMDKIDLEKKTSPYSNADLESFKHRLAQHIVELQK